MPSEPAYPYGSNLDIVWREDPRMLGIRLARYKFVAKMFAGRDNVIEIGAGDGALSRVVAPAVKRLVITDGNPPAGIERWNPADSYLAPEWMGQFDGAYALDVLEHVPAKIERRWLAGIAAALNPDGALIIGCPSAESQPYASRKSRESHVNCKTEDGLRDALRPHFRHVFLFGMNDEVVHTGFGPMCHYRLALCAGKRPLVTERP